MRIRSRCTITAEARAEVERLGFHAAADIAIVYREGPDLCASFMREDAGRFRRVAMVRILKGANGISGETETAVD